MSLPGPLGDGHLKFGKYNLRLIRKVLRSGCEIKGEYWDSLIQQLGTAVESKQLKTRDLVSILKAFKDISANEIKRAELALKVEKPSGTTVYQQTNVNVDATDDAAVELLGIIDSLRHRAGTVTDQAATNGHHSPNGSANGSQPG